MGVSDLITLLGLVIAIITLISEQNRDFLLLKFRKTNFILLTFVFLFINYLVFYDYFLHIKNLEIIGWPNPKDWAYIITLIVLVYLIYKIFYAFFAASNKGKVLMYYNKLLFNDEHLNIISLFDKYHKADLLQHLEDSTRGGTRIEYANNIYHEIISRDDFISKTANARPYFYSDIISKFTENQFTNEQVLTVYLNTIISSENQFLFREIRNNQNYSDGGFMYRLPNENKILNALLFNLDVAANNLVWQPFGECTIRELKREQENGFLSTFNKSFSEKDEVWHTITYNSIWFFDIMVRKAIVENYQSHFWLHYYKFFVEELCNTVDMNEMNNIDEDAEFPTRLHFLIYEIFSNIKNWIEYCSKTNNEFHSSEATKCLGSCLKVLTENNGVSEDFKIVRINTAINLYFKTFRQRNNNTTINNLVDCYLKPGGLEPTAEYIRLFLLSRNSFDKDPYLGFENNGSIKAFENDVIIILSNKY